MGMFDRYEFATTQACERCGELLTSCQGKDGPNVLVTWREGQARMALGQRMDEPLGQLEPFGLPKRFTFSCWCPNGHRRDFVGECVDGVWQRTVPATVSGGAPILGATDLS